MRLQKADRRKNKRKEIGKLDRKVGLGDMMKDERREKKEEGGREGNGRGSGRRDSSKTSSFRSAMSNGQRTQS